MIGGYFSSELQGEGVPDLGVLRGTSLQGKGYPAITSSVGGIYEPRNRQLSAASWDFLFGITQVVHLRDIPKGMIGLL